MITLDRKQTIELMTDRRKVRSGVMKKAEFFAKYKEYVEERPHFLRQYSPLNPELLDEFLSVHNKTYKHLPRVVEMGTEEWDELRTAIGCDQTTLDLFEQLGFKKVIVDKKVASKFSLR